MKTGLHENMNALQLFQPIVIWHEGREKSHLKISGRSKIPSNDVSQGTMPHFLHVHLVIFQIFLSHFCSFPFISLSF